MLGMITNMPSHCLTFAAEELEMIRAYPNPALLALPEAFFLTIGSVPKLELRLKGLMLKR